MGLFAIDILCPQCDLRWDDLVDRNEDTWELRFECSRCGCEDCSRTMSAPNMTKASYPDGYKRGPGYDAMKEASKMKAERANLPMDKRNDINKAIRTVEKQAASGYIKKEKGQ
jgi:hypothetical protein